MDTIQTTALLAAFIVALTQAIKMLLGKFTQWGWLKTSTHEYIRSKLSFFATGAGGIAGYLLTIPGTYEFITTNWVFGLLIGFTATFGYATLEDIMRKKTAVEK
jgi:hypothetical protein